MELIRFYFVCMLNMYRILSYPNEVGYLSLIEDAFQKNSIIKIDFIDGFTEIILECENLEK